MNKLVVINNISTNICLANRAKVARNLWSRITGLIGKKDFNPGEGLVLLPCKGIHTLGMRFPIDVLYVSETGIVTKILSGIKPNRWGPVLKETQFIIELPASIVQRTGTKTGDRIMLRSCSGAGEQ